MIFAAFINIYAVFVGLINTLLPDAPRLSDSMLLWLGYFHSGITMIGFILPINTFFEVLGIVIVIEGYMLSIRIAMFIIRIFKP